MPHEGVIVWGPKPDPSRGKEPVIIWGPESGRLDAVPYDSPLLNRPPPERGPVIIWNTRDPLGGMTAEAFEVELRRLLTGRVESAWIFGSYGTPAFNRDSDVDMMLVVKTDTPFLERILDFSDVKYLVPDMDLLVYTPEEFCRLTADPSPGFWTSAVASMRRIV
jgi:predicted nucleotidyltransferase